MMTVIFFTLALFLPCLLGFAVTQRFLEQRKGYWLFSLGAGYVLGWFLATFILRVYDYFQRPFNIYEIVIIECIAVFLLLLLLKSEKNIAIPSRPAPSPSALMYFLVGGIGFLLLYRWGLSAIDLLSKPVFPWDGWSSWSAKAKIFYFYQQIPTLVEGYPFWSLPDHKTIDVIGARHPNFISLIQAYVALAWGGWDDNLVNLPWLGLSMAMASTVYGGIRYLGGNYVLALLACYAVTSLPIVDTHVSLGSYADLWVGASLLVTVFLFGILWNNHEWRLLFLLLIYAIIVYQVKNTAFIFLCVIFLIIIWRLIGSLFYFSLLAFLTLTVCLFAFSDWQLSMDVKALIIKLFSSGIGEKLITYNPVFEQVWLEWLILDNWHYVFSVGLVSMVMILFQKNEKNYSTAMMLVIMAFSVFFVFLLITFFTTKMSENAFVGYFNRVSLYMVPVFLMGIVGVYQLMSRCHEENSNQ